MMKYPLSTLLVLWAAVQLVWAQDTKLDTRTIYRRYATQEVAVRTQKQALESERLTAKNKEREIKKNTTDKERTIQYQEVVIPVVFHFLYTPEKDIVYEKEAYSQLQILNNDFSETANSGTKPAQNANPAYFKEGFDRRTSKTGVSFCLAEGPGKQVGIVKMPTKVKLWNADQAMKSKRSGGSDPWDTEKYLNIWIVHLPDSVGGYAQMPGGLATTDGIVIDYRFFGTYYYARKPYHLGRTLSHLVGSYLGLKELWDESTPCGDDEIDDTPIHNAPNYGSINVYQHISTCDGYPVEMTMNIMDASEDASAFMFTAGQKKRVQIMLSKGGPREKLGQGGSLCQKEEKGEKLAEPELAELNEVRRLTLQAYPNPTNNRFVLTLNPPAVGTCEIQIINFAGRLMSKQQLQLDEGYYQTEINTQSWPSGLYFVHCRMNGQTVSQTVSVLRN